MRKVLVLNGHPDPRPERLCAALAAAYCAGAEAAGHEVRRIDVGALEYPLIRSFDDFTKTEAPVAIAEAQASIRWADHLVIIHPLWLGAAPAVLKGFLEQVFRYGFALGSSDTPTGRLLKGRSARVVVTMGMPALVFRWWFGAHGLKSTERGILWISGFGPIRHSIIGSVEGSPAARQRMLRRLRKLGAAAR